jgi:hypothetical protein
VYPECLQGFVRPSVRLESIRANLDTDACEGLLLRLELETDVFFPQALRKEFQRICDIVLEPIIADRSHIVTHIRVPPDKLT